MNLLIGEKGVIQYQNTGWQVDFRPLPLLHHTSDSENYDLTKYVA